jgi:hypothetical protein
MSASVRSRAHRILAKLETFQVLDRHESSDLVPGWLPGEEAIGRYRNHTGTPDDDLLVTTMGVRTRSGGTWPLVPFSSIEHVALPHSEDKEVVDSLRLRLRDGRRVELPVRGGSGKFRDAWEFLRFLNRVMTDMREPHDSP